MCRIESHSITVSMSCFLQCICWISAVEDLSQPFWSSSTSTVGGDLRLIFAGLEGGLFTKMQGLSMSFQDMFPMTGCKVFFFYCDVDIDILEQLDHAKHAGSIRGQANQ